MASIKKLMEYEMNFGVNFNSSLQTVLSVGISCNFKSKTITVIMMAITPSLNASILLVGI
jgi:hypothetical protein